MTASLEAYQADGALAGTFATMESVDAVGVDQVELRFSEPAGYMVNVLAGEAGMVTTPEALADPDMGTNPVGTGPFRLDSVQEGKVTYSRFEDYWDADSVGIAGIEMTVFSDEATRLRAVRSGESDGTTIAASQVDEAEASGLTVVGAPNTTFNGLLLNTGVEPLSEPGVREALLCAIDRRSISDNLYDGSCAPTVQPLQEGFWAHAPELNDVSSYHDPDEARELLAEAGYPDGLDMTLEVGPNTSYQTLGQALQAQLEAVGIRVSLQVLELQQMVEARRTGEFTATVSLLQAGRPDPSQFLAEFYLPGGLYNAGGFELPGGAEPLAAARASDDVEARAEPMREAVALALESGPPVVPICGVSWQAAVREGVTGMEAPVVGDYDFAAVQMSAG